jgi:hypothetical protein
MNQVPRKGILIFVGVLVAFWVFLTCLGAKNLVFDRALSDPVRAATANAEVIEYRFPGHGGWATYRFVVADTGSSFTNRGSIDRQTYDHLASGGVRTISVQYLRDAPHTNAPSSGIDVSEDIWLVIIGILNSLFWGWVGWSAWRRASS